MDALTRRRTVLSSALRSRPVIASLFTPDDLEAFLDTDAPVCILANADLFSLETVMERLSAADRFVFVNIDTTSGLAADRGGIEFLVKTGASGVVTTHGSIVSRTEADGLVAMQKLFVTDRLNLPRATQGLERTRPTYVQVMPAPVLPYIMDAPIMQICPVVAGGFVSSQRSLIAAIACGATAVSTSERSLWTYRKDPT